MGQPGNIVGERVEAGTVDVEEGRVGSTRLTKQRALHVNLRDNDGVELSTIPVSLSGVATEAKQDVQEISLDAINAAQLPDGHNVTVDNASIAVTAASLPLPSGAATAANQILSKTKKKNTIDFTASQTAQTIWDPTTSTTYHITGWVISFSAAGTFHMFDDTDTTGNRVAKYFGAANGGANLSSLDIPGGAADNILKYTTGAGCVGSITVFGFEE